MSFAALLHRLLWQPRRAAGRPSFRPQVDVLEERAVPALFVESLSDALADRPSPAIAGPVHSGPSAGSGGLGTVSSSGGNVNTDTEGVFHAETTLAVNPTKGGRKDLKAPNFRPADRECARIRACCSSQA